MGYGNGSNAQLVQASPGEVIDSRRLKHLGSVWMVPILYHNRLVVASEVRSSRWCYDRTFNLVSTKVQADKYA